MDLTRTEPSRPAVPEGVERFLTACATALLDRAALLEAAAGQVAEALAKQGEEATRELAAGLLSLDRLTREISSVGEALLQYGGSLPAYAEVDGEHALAKRVIDRVVPGDLKTVLRRMTECHTGLAPQPAFATWPAAVPAGRAISLIGPASESVIRSGLAPPTDGMLAGALASSDTTSLAPASAR